MGRIVVVIMSLVLVASACTSEDPTAETGATSLPDRLGSAEAVSAEDIIFDTFDGGSLPLSRASAAEVERLLAVGSLARAEELIEDLMQHSSLRRRLVGLRLRLGLQPS